MLGLFAHPDDEVFCAGGVLAMAAQQGADTMVVSFTRGEAGAIRHANVATRSSLGEVRAAELRRSCDELGIGYARCLDFPDGGLARTDRAILVEAAVEQIRSFRPDSMLGYASDHLSIEWFPEGSYIIEQGEPAASLYLVLSGSVDVIVEADGETHKVGSATVGDFLGETAIATGQARGAHCVAAESTACFVLSPSARSNHAPRGASGALASNSECDPMAPDGHLGVDHSIDVGAFVRHKVAALAQHRSQYTIAPGLFPDIMMDELLGTERFVCAWTSATGNPAQRGPADQRA